MSTQRPLKGLLLLGMGYFLFSRISGGTLFYYISNRFAWLTFLAVAGLFIVGGTFFWQEADAWRRRTQGRSHDPEADHAQAHGEDHAHGQPLSGLGALLLLLPLLFGAVIPPRPLGAAALANREINAGGLGSAALPQTSKLATNDGRKNLLDWLLAFNRTPNPQAFDGQAASVVGFVYRDGRFAGDEFMVSRFIVSCCVADASPVGLIVRWPRTAELTTDQWVEIAGRFSAGQFAGQPIPVLIADQVTLTSTPQQPYLFP